jgi:hypothetical protein
MKFGGPSVARQQLQHLLDMSEREHITILVIPFDAGGYPGSGQSVCMRRVPCSSWTRFSSTSRMVPCCWMLKPNSKSTGSS